ncbi:Biotin-lipoyl like [Gammaproteobacteria bacterium]
MPFSELSLLSPEALTLATLVYLTRRAREARDTAELAFIAVNETHGLASYRQAVLWLRRKGVVALSGVVSPEANAPYVQWLNRISRHLEQFTSQPHVVLASNLPVQEREEWGEWLPEHAVWVPLPAVDWRFAGGALLLVREQSWSEEELVFLAEWAAVYSHAYALKEKSFFLGRRWQTEKKNSVFGGIFPWARLGIIIITVSALFLPVRLTVLAPAELIPLHPAVIRAPLDGVVDRLLVVPNQTVEKNQPLLEFDRISIQNRHQVAVLALASVQTEYRQKAQQALNDPVSKSQLAALQGQLAEKEADVAYLQTINQRGVVLSPDKGIVLFDDPNGWMGKPVVTGERIMMVANEQAVEVEAWLSPADAIPLASGARITLFLNTDPLVPLEASLYYVAYEAQQRPDGHYAYRVRAQLTQQGISPRIGLKGTAKLEGEEASLAYWIMRRPLAGIRTWLGW